VNIPSSSVLEAGLAARGERAAASTGIDQTFRPAPWTSVTAAGNAPGLPVERKKKKKKKKKKNRPTGRPTSYRPAGFSPAS